MRAAFIVGAMVACMLLPSACGASSNTVSEPCASCGDAPLGAARFRVPPTLSELPVDLQRDEPLEDAFERAREVYRAQDIESFDPRVAYATSAAADFSWYFTINDANDDFARTQHVYFVATAPWTDANTRNFLLSYVVMSAASNPDVGRPWFHLYSAYPPPRAVQFLFSNSALAHLEAAILVDLGTGTWNPGQAPMLAERIRSYLVDLELATPAQLEEPCPMVLDAIFLGLPRPEATEAVGVFARDYTPEGTLAALGLLLGESVRDQAGTVVEWETDDVSAIYPRLRVHLAEESIARPIPILIEAYLGDGVPLPSTYCTYLSGLVGEHPPAQGD